MSAPDGSKPGARTPNVGRGLNMTFFDALRGAVTQWVQAKAQDWFFPPGIPPKPVAPDGFQPRDYDFPANVNIQLQPRADETVNFDQLRNLADSHDITRICIEMIKNQIAKIPFKVRLKRQPGQSKKKANEKSITDARVKLLNDFFAYPDKENSFSSWVRSLVEDVLVVDALSIVPRFTRDGSIYCFDQVDGATIKRVISNEGKTPMPPDAAYQQFLHGMPAVNISAPQLADITMPQLIYRPRNKRIHKPYGYPPVEQIIMTINIALRREMHLLNYYTNGSINDLLIGVPETWGPERTRKFTDYWNNMLSGNSAKRRQTRFIPMPQGSNLTANALFAKDPKLKDEIDDWLSSIVAAAFSVPRQSLVKAMNRAQSEQANDEALAQGLEPLLLFLGEVITFLISFYFGFDDIEGVFGEDKHEDPKTQAEIHDKYLRNGTLTIDNVLEDLGLDPAGYDQHLVYTMNGVVSIDQALEAADLQNERLANPPDPSGDGSPPNNSGGSSSSGQAGSSGKKPKTSKKKLIKISAGTKTRAMQKVRGPLVKFFTEFLAKEAKRIEKVIVAAYRRETGLKADDSTVRKIMDDLKLDSWVETRDTTEEALQGVFSDGNQHGLVEVGVDSSSALFDVVDENAVDYAQQRSAELVGKKFTDAGDLIDNPNARWAITESTREKIRALVEQAVTDGMTPDELSQAIVDDFAFSASRAELIADTELAMANVAGNLEGWRQSGVVEKKGWLLSNDHDHDDECDDNAEQGEIDLDDVFESGDDGPPAHPRCECDVYAVTKSPDEEEE